MIAGARLVLIAAVVGGYLLLGEVAAPADGTVPLAALVGLLACAAIAAVAGPLAYEPVLPDDEGERMLEEAWIETMEQAPHLHLDRRPEIAWDLHAVHVGREGTEVVLRHLVNALETGVPDAAPPRVRIRVAEERTFTGDEVVEASTALDDLREAAMESEALSRVRAYERTDRRVREEQEELERAYREAARRRDGARLAELARYRAELGRRLAAERAAQERRDAEREAHGLAKALRESRHPGPR